MPDLRQTPLLPRSGRIEREQLSRIREILPTRRWFRRKSDQIADLSIADQAHAGAFTWLFLHCGFSRAEYEHYSIGLQGTEYSEAEWIAPLVSLLREGKTISTKMGGHIEVEWFADSPWPSCTSPKIMAPESSNTMVVLSPGIVGKILRAPLAGPNAEVEIGSRLTRTGYPRSPRLLGYMRYVAKDGQEYALALFTELVEQGRDMWAYLQGLLAVRDYNETFPVLHQVGAALAELHLTLSTIAEEAFKPETVQPDFISRWIANLRQSSGKALRMMPLEEEKIRLNKAFDSVQALAPLVLSNVKRIRQHGDFHLGQVLRNPQGDVFLIDFEGEVLASSQERRQKHLPLKDAAGLVRSLHYASHAAVILSGSTDRAGLQNWYHAARIHFLDSYFNSLGKAAFLPVNPYPLLQLLEFEKALYELQYEIQNRPQWVGIPLSGILEVSADLSR